MADAQTRDHQLAQCIGEQAPDLEGTYWSLFSETVKKYPNNEAVVSLWQHDFTAKENNVLRWTYADISNHSGQVARWLRAQGCRPGMRLIVFLFNSAEWTLFMWAAAQIGMVFVPADPNAIGNDGKMIIENTSSDVIIVHDLEAAELLDKSASSSFKDKTIRILCSLDELAGWVSLSSMMKGEASSTKVTNGDIEVDPREPVLIVFTSGTTSNPKGCPLTAANVWSQTYDYEPSKGFDRWLVHTPVCHIMGVNHILRGFRSGGAVVFSGKRFSVEATLPALRQEKVTKMAAVPTLVRALLANEGFCGKSELALHYITIGGTVILPEDIRMCKEGLGVEAAIQGFGMTEGLPVATWISDDPLLVSRGGYHEGVGKVMQGANMRICVPKTTEIVARNEVGELHIGGTSVISSYLHGVEPETFYEDKFGSWLRTGDQARIDNDGVLHILGRYKDLIIRGGENISPAKIEAALNEIPEVVAQIVGCPDPVAGEVPVAVIKASGSCTKPMIYEKAMQIGPMYALGAVYFLEELGLQNFPLTVLGKMKKEALKEAIKTHRDKSRVQNVNGATTVGAQVDGSDTGVSLAQNPETFVRIDPNPLTASGPALKEEAKDDTLSKMILIWEDLTGITPDPDDNILKFADSITILRYCEQVLNVLAGSLYLQDFADHQTVREQAALLKLRSKQQPISEDTNGSAMGIKRFGFDNVVFADGSPKRLAEIQVAGATCLESLNLPVSDIEDFLPIKDTFIPSAFGQRSQSWHHHLETTIRDASVQEVREGLRAALTNRAIFRTLLSRLSDGTPFHVVMKPSDRLFGYLIKEIEVADDQSTSNLEKDDSDSIFSTPIMFQAIIIKVAGADDLHVKFCYNHTIFDLMTLMSWYQDLDRSISNPNSVLAPLTPFKWYTDLTYMYQSSALARVTEDFTVARLRRISKIPNVLWPKQRSPGWMVGTDADSAYAAERAAVRARIWETTPTDEILIKPLVSIRVHCVNLMKIKSNLGIQPKIVLQTAIAIFNVQTTGVPIAVFNALDAGRKWPFVPEFLSARLPSAASIAGPTLESTLSMTWIDIGGAETVAQLMARVMAEQEVLSTHAHVPWFKVLERVGKKPAELTELLFRQTFTWDSSTEIVNWGRIKCIGRRDWPDAGVFWDGYQLESSVIGITAAWDTAQMNEQEMIGHCDRLGSILSMLTDPGNLDMALRDVFLEDELT